MTLIKFLKTKDTYHNVTNARGQSISRTAWAKDARAWPTWMYFAVAAVSVLLNFFTVFAYKFGFDKANKASYIATTFSWVMMIGNLVVWSVAAGLYRTEKDKDGKSNDLWGWTCSAGARAIQKEFASEIDFNRFCNVQVRLEELVRVFGDNFLSGYQLVYWPGPSGSRTANGYHLHYGVYAEAIEEESAATIETERIRADETVGPSVNFLSGDEQLIPYEIMNVGLKPKNYAVTEALTELELNS